jgi:hypothetical protein
VLVALESKSHAHFASRPKFVSAREFVLLRWRMKDRRVAFVRGALTELVESLDATLRVWRRNGDAVPAPLSESAGLLLERLGRANRIAAGQFAGSQRSTEQFSAMRSAIERLDLAFVAFRNASDKADAESVLDAELARVRTEIELDPPT